MRRYVNKPMAELAVDLTAGLKRLRKKYVDAAETLARIIDPAREYPHEFIVFRLTGFRGRTSSPVAQPMEGKTLRDDLLRLMLDICDSFDLRGDDYDEPVFIAPALAERFGVSAKTVQRWRRRGLAARRLILSDGKRRIAFLESSIEWFFRDRNPLPRQPKRFTRMSPQQRLDIVSGARQMVSGSSRPLSEVAKRLSRQTGRAVETVRYTIRTHDLEHPHDAVFPAMSARLSVQDKQTIYRRFLRGIPVPLLARRYRRTRGSIYRIINEVRARQLLDRPIAYMYNPQFDLPNIEDVIGVDSPPATPVAKTDKAPKDIPPYLGALYKVELLTSSEERDLFRRFNYLKYKADTLRRQIDVSRIQTSHLKRIESLLLRANAVKNQIIRANLRLVVSIAKKHVSGPQSLFELISDGNVSLMRAAEKFDYSRGFRFSTYASWAIMRNFARSVPRERHQLDRFSTGFNEVLEVAAALRTYDPNEVNLAEMRESIDVVLSQLTPTERVIVTDHYGLGREGEAKTLQQRAKRLKLSKERVRQIEIRAMKKLRKIMRPEEVDLLT